VSAPWWHPEANPLRDIRNMKRAIALAGPGDDVDQVFAEVEAVEEDREAEAVLAALLREPLPPGPYWVLAPSYRQALYWAGQRRVPRQDWRFIQSPADLMGVRGGTCVLLNGMPDTEVRFARVSGMLVVRETA
jgi:hypothetical protein